jgi:perosamine synthetase
MRYPVAAPHLSGREAAYVNECLRTNWISSQGQFISRFEDGFASAVHRKHALATCNGTVALHLALLGLGVGPGDEVIVPSLTYIATANAVAYCGATPVFADSDPKTWCISAASVARLISSRTKGIIPVHLYGHPCDMKALGELVDAHRLWIVEDCAEAFGATFDGRPVGSFGAASMFSFFGNKILTTGEGGMVVTNDDQLAARMRLVKGQGMDPSKRYWHPMIGYNYRMTNIAAAIGLGQLEHVDQLMGDRKRIAGWYRDRLRNVPGLTLPGEAPGASNIYWLYSILLDEPAVRDPFIAELAKAEIETRPLFYPVHVFPMYRQCRTDAGCEVACDLSSRGINLPTSSYLAENDIDVIAAAVRRVMERLSDRTNHEPIRKAA